MCLCLTVSHLNPRSVSHLPTSAMMNCVSLLSCLVAEMSSFTLLIIAQLPLIKLLFTSVHNFSLILQTDTQIIPSNNQKINYSRAAEEPNTTCYRNTSQQNHRETCNKWIASKKNKPEKLNSKHVCQYESSKFVNWTELKCKHIKISEAWHFSLQNILKPKWRRQ